MVEKINLRDLEELGFEIASILDKTSNKEKREKKFEELIENTVKKFQLNKIQKQCLLNWVKELEEKGNTVDDPISLLNFTIFADDESINEILIDKKDSKKERNISRFLSDNIDIEKRCIYMDDSSVDDYLAESTIKAIHILDNLTESNEPITIIMNSSGGDVYAGLAIYDMIKSANSKINIIGIGQVFSMGAWILQAGSKRYLTKNTRFMIHQGYVGMSPNVPEINKRWMDQWSEDEELFVDILEEKITSKYKTDTLKVLKKLYIHYNPKQENQVKGIDDSRVIIKNFLEFDTILNAKETIELGLADEIIEKISDIFKK